MTTVLIIASRYLPELNYHHTYHTVVKAWHQVYCTGRLHITTTQRRGPVKNWEWLRAKVDPDTYDS